MLWLETAASSHDAHSFAVAVEAIDWQARPADEIARAVQLALIAGAHIQARRLAMDGAARFPDHPELRKAAHILQPPTATVVAGNGNEAWRGNMEWLHDNWEQYKNKWIALRGGELLAVADSVDELVEKAGDPREAGYLLTKPW